MRKLQAVIAGVVAIPLFLTSGVTCSCEPNPFDVSGQMRIYKDPGEEIVSAAENTRLGKAAFLGRDIRSLPLENGTVDRECVFVNAHELHCEFWNEVGFLYSSGRFVQIRAAHNGKVVRVEVTKVSQLFGVTFNHPNNAFRRAPSAPLN